MTNQQQRHMRNARRRRRLGLVAALAITGTAAGHSAAGGLANSPGIDDDTILLGTSLPISGPASALGVISGALDGCVAKLNQAGGVTMADGVTRRLELITYDDGYDPARTVENVRRLVEQDEVFALWATLGTGSNAAIWDYANDEGVPHAFILSGASMFGTGFLGDHPHTLGWQPAYTTEAAAYGQWLLDEHPAAKVAILSQNDDYGHDFLAGFNAAISDSDVTVVASATYNVSDPTIDQQLTELASSDAEVFLNISTPKFATMAIARMAELDWRPIHILASPAASRAVFEPAGIDNSIGIITAQFLKDPFDDRWTDDAGVQQYLADVAEYSPDTNPGDAFAVIGWAECESIAQLLSKSDPTRASVVEQLHSIDEENSLLLPGIVARTGPDDGFMIESLQMGQFDGDRWDLIGELISFEGATPTLG